MASPNTPSSQNSTDHRASKSTSGSVKRFEREISKWILAVIGIFFLLLILAEIGVAAGILQAAPINELTSLYKNILLPIATLVLGHYFGSRNQ